jgi:hypothetical protein
MRLTVFLFGLLFFGISINSQAQNDSIKLVVHGRLIDALSGKAISGANISIPYTTIGTSSVASGEFSLKLVAHRDSFPLTIRITHVSYEAFESSISKDFNRKLTLRLVPQIMQMEAVEIYSGPRQIASPYFSQILDYEVYKDNIVLLEKLDNSRKNRVRIVDFNGNLKGETIVKGKAVSLFKDCRDEVYLIMYDRYLKINDDAGVYVSRTTQNLENRIKNPCRAITDSFLIYEEYGYARLMSWLLKRKYTDKHSSLFYFSANRLSIRLIQEDLLALRMKYGNIIQDLMYVEASLDNTEESRIRDLVMEEDLSEQSLFYQPNYCPIFKEGKNFRVFDHGNNSMLLLNSQGTEISSKRIKYHTKLAWQPQLFYDESNQNYFTLMKRGSWTTLYQIDIINGGITLFHKINNAFPEKIKVHNGYLLYLYRRSGTAQRYSLYLEPY